MSLTQAKREGVVKARNQAIDSAFYSVVGGLDEVTLKNKNGNSDVSFMSIRRSQVKGVWLGDLAEPIFKQTLADDGRHFLDITVKGKARELKSAGIQFEALPLRVKPDLKLQTDSFKDGDDFFLYFRSLNGIKYSKCVISLDHGVNGKSDTYEYPVQRCDNYHRVVDDTYYHVAEWRSG